MTSRSQKRTRHLPPHLQNWLLRPRAKRLHHTKHYNPPPLPRTHPKGRARKTTEANCRWALALAQNKNLSQPTAAGCCSCIVWEIHKYFFFFFTLHRMGETASATVYIVVSHQGVKETIHAPTEAARSEGHVHAVRLTKNHTKQTKARKKVMLVLVLLTLAMKTFSGNVSGLSYHTTPKRSCRPRVYALGSEAFQQTTALW